MNTLFSFLLFYPFTRGDKQSTHTYIRHISAERVSSSIHIYLTHSVPIMPYYIPSRWKDIKFGLILFLVRVYFFILFYLWPCNRQIGVPFLSLRERESAVVESNRATSTSGRKAREGREESGVKPNGAHLHAFSHGFGWLACSLAS